MGMRLGLGTVAVIFCALAGRSFARGNTRRARLLMETMDALQFLRIHMLDRLLPLSAALARSQAAVLRETGALMEGRSAGEAWWLLRARESGREGMLDCLTAPDLTALDTFFDSLGTTSRSEQKPAFDTAIKTLGALEASARSSGAEKSKLYTTLGALAGAAAVIGFI